MRSSLRSVLREVIWSSGDEKRWPVSSLDLPGNGLQPSQDLLRHLQTNVLGCLVRIHMSVDVQEPEMVLAIANFLQEEQMVWLLTVSYSWLKIFRFRQ